MTNKRDTHVTWFAALHSNPIKITQIFSPIPNMAEGTTERGYSNDPDVRLSLLALMYSIEWLRAMENLEKILLPLANLAERKIPSM